MMKKRILAYMFDCHKFQYNERIITGLCCAVKVDSSISEHEMHKFVSVHLSRKNGFTITNTSPSFNVQIYKIYLLALCDNQEEETIEIEKETLALYTKYIIESMSCSAESQWFMDKC